jgi:hypothetical protein
VLNGLPAIVSDALTRRRPTEAPRTVLACELGADGRIAVLYAVVASRKLTAVTAG